MDRSGKEQLVRDLSMAVLSGADEHWERALAVEQGFVAERARQDGLRHEVAESIRCGRPSRLAGLLRIDNRMRRMSAHAGPTTFQQFRHRS